MTININLCSRTHRLAIIHNVTNDRRRRQTTATNRRKTVAWARPLLRSAKNRNQTRYTVTKCIKLILYFILNKKAVLSQRWPRDALYIHGSNEPLRRYGHSKLSKMATCRQIGFDVTGNSAIQSADPENPTVEPNMKCIGSPVAEVWQFVYLLGIWNSFCGKERS